MERTEKVLWYSLAGIDLSFLITAMIVCSVCYHNAYRVSSLVSVMLVSLGFALAARMGKRSQPVLRRGLLAVTGAASVVCIFLFLFFLPSYTVNQAAGLLREDSEFSQGEIQAEKEVYPFNETDNPFGGYGYAFVYRDAKGKEYPLCFDPYSGRYWNLNKPADS